MKKFYNEMDLNNTIAYMVQKMDTYYYKYDVYTRAIGDDKAASKAYRHYELSRKILAWLQSKPHQLVCQYCGSIHDVKIVGDFSRYYILCPDCVNPGWSWSKAKKITWGKKKAA